MSGIRGFFLLQLLVLKTTALQRPVLVSVRPLLAFPTTHNTLIYLAFPLPGARIPNFL